MQATTTTTKLSLKSLKREVYALLDCDATKQVKRAYPSFDLRQRSSWIAIKELEMAKLSPAMRAVMEGAQAMSATMDEIHRITAKYDLPKIENGPSPEGSQALSEMGEPWAVQLDWQAGRMSALTFIGDMAHATGRLMADDEANNIVPFVRGNWRMRAA